MPTGVYKRTEEHKRKLKEAQNRPEVRNKKSKALRGRKFSEENIEKMRQNSARYWLGKKRPSPSKETKEKMRKTALINGNKPPVRYGAENNLWKGGISRGYKTGYYSTEYKKWRIAVFERDGYRCQGCGQVGGYLTAHHIKSFAHYPKLRFIVDNGITLCEKCHRLTDNYKGHSKNKNKQI